MRYTPQDYERDLNDPAMPHLGTRERFKAFYEQLALGPAKRVTYPAHRMDWIDLTRGGWVIELGCHVGYDLIHWTSQDPDLVAWGVDVSENMLNEARRRVSALPTSQQQRIQLTRAFIEDLIMGAVLVGAPKGHDEPTDIVLTEVLEHVQDPLPVLKVAVELARSGTLWITTPITRWGNFSHVRGIPPDEMGELLRGAGASPQGQIWTGQGMTFAKIPSP
jgi:2-polyprenyl-3-methyl-5-hydroxy-6-metoxy-1,4-benzoquinol methylase